MSSAAKADIVEESNPTRIWGLWCRRWWLCREHENTREVEKQDKVDISTKLHAASTVNTRTQEFRGADEDEVAKFDKGNTHTEVRNTKNAFPRRQQGHAVNDVKRHQQ